MPEPRFAGVDVGLDRLHAVLLDGRGEIAAVHAIPVFPQIGGYFFEFAEWLARARVVAIDAPLAPSTSPHADDAALSPKFRAARCGEIALGRQKGIWVPWVAARTMTATPWMRVGFLLAGAVARPGVRVLETYPYAAFRLLGSGRLGKKTSGDGFFERLAILRSIHPRGPEVEMWGHDGLDALMAAEVAAGVESGRSEAISCGHDDSAIWVPKVGGEASTF